MKKTVKNILKTTSCIMLLAAGEMPATAQTLSQNMYLNDYFLGLRGTYDQTWGIKYYLNRLESRAGQGGFIWKYCTPPTGAGPAPSETILMQLDDQGRLGIGIPNPSYPLDVKGRMRITSNGTSVMETAGIWYKSTDERVFAGLKDASKFGFCFTSIGWKIGMDSYTGYMGIGTMDPTEQLHVAGTSKMDGKLVVTGYTGIGTLTPAEQLHVAGNSKMDGNMVVSGNIDANKNFNVNLAGANGSSTSPGNFQIKGASGTSLAFVQASTGRVGIGTTTPSEKLQVAGKIKAEAFVTDAGKFPDYIFAEDYSLMPLPELENYINTHNKLPGMPSEAEVKKNGLELQKIAIISVEKIEELSLYMIAAQKHIEVLQSRIAALEVALNKETDR